METTPQPYENICPLCPDPNVKILANVRRAGLIFAFTVLTAGLVFWTIRYRLWERAALTAATAEAAEKIIGCNNTPAFYTHNPETGAAVDEIYLCLGERHHTFWTARPVAAAK